MTQKKTIGHFRKATDHVYPGTRIDPSQHIMMTLCDNRVGDFGGSIKFLFNETSK